MNELRILTVLQHVGVGDMAAGRRYRVAIAENENLADSQLERGLDTERSILNLLLRGIHALEIHCVEHFERELTHPFHERAPFTEGKRICLVASQEIADHLGQAQHASRTDFLLVCLVSPRPVLRLVACSIPECSEELVERVTCHDVPQAGCCIAVDRNGDCERVRVEGFQVQAIVADAVGEAPACGGYHSHGAVRGVDENSSGCVWHGVLWAQVCFPARVDQVSELCTIRDGMALTVGSFASQGTGHYFRLFSIEAAAWFLSRFAIFFSFAVIAAGFFAAFWPLSLDTMVLISRVLAPEPNLSDSYVSVTGRGI